MNKSMLSRTRYTAQSGFTLIELIVVIVILGILAATALPKFGGLSGDARRAGLVAMGSNLTSISNMAHAKYAIDPTATTMTFEDKTVTFAQTSGSVNLGYPKADAGLAEAAGASSAGATDYTYYVTQSASGTKPAVAANSIGIVPTAAVGTSTETTCVVVYTMALTAGSTPSVTLPTAAQCQ